MAISLLDVETLKKLPMFVGLPGEAVIDILAPAIARHYTRRTLLFVQGDEADRFFVILGGWIKLFRQARDGAEAVIEVFGPGESFAEAAMFGSGRYPVSAETASDVRLLEIPSAAFKARLAKDPDLMFRMLATMSSRLKRFVRRTEQLATRTASQRVAAFLLNFVDGTVDGEARTITLPYDKFLIAGRLGMKPETFSRALAGLRAAGVTVSGSTVRIEDLPVFERFAEE